MTETARQKLNKTVKILAVALLCVSFVSYFSFYYFHPYGHIEKFSDAVFVLLQWVKLAGLVIIPAAVFLKTEKFSFFLRWILPICALLSLAFAAKYIGQVPAPASKEQELYPALVYFMPKTAVLVLFILEALLMAGICVLTRVLSKPLRRQTPRHASVPFLLVMLAVLPLSLFENLTRFLWTESGFYQFLLFKNFTVWHLLAFWGVFTAAYLAYRLLKRKDKASRRKYMCVFALAVLVQYMSKASRLLGDGYNVYYTVIAFIPLFICNIGIPVAAAAIFTQNKRLRDIAFFVHAAGALTVFFYFGKNDMSNYGTVFHYSFLYFVFTHAGLFVMCVLPALLGGYTFKIKQTLVPMAYYAAVVLIAAFASELVTAITANLYGAEFAIRPNYAFTQVCPLPIELLQWNVNIFGLVFNLFYLPLLFLAYVAIFFIFWGGYYLIFERRKIRTQCSNPHK